VLRGEFANDEDAMSHRSEWYFGMSNMLKMYSDSFDVMFVLANQVSYDVKTSLLKPALGLAWSYCVNQRFVLHFEEESQNDDQVVNSDMTNASVRIRRPRRRYITVAFSPYRNDGPLPISCIVTSKGFEGV